MQKRTMQAAYQHAYRLAMDRLVRERRPWARHDQDAVRFAFARCREDAHHEALLALRIRAADLKVVPAGPAPAPAPGDAHGL